MVDCVFMVRRLAFNRPLSLAGSLRLNICDNDLYQLANIFIECFWTVLTGHKAASFDALPSSHAISAAV